MGVIMESNSSEIIMVGEKILELLQDGVKTLTKTKIFYYTILSLFIKSLIVVGDIYYENPSISQMLISYKQISHVYIYLFFILIFASISFLFKNRAHLWFLIILNLFFSILFIVDLWYFRGFNAMPTLYLLKETSNLNNLSDTVMSLAHKSDILLILDFLFLVPYAIMNKKLCKNQPRNIGVFLILFFISAAYTIYVPFKTDVLGKYDAEQSFLIVRWKPSITVCNASPIGYHFVDIYNYVKDSKRLVLTGSDKKEIKNWFNAKKENSSIAEDNQYKGIFKGQNLLVIQVESLENFVVGKSVNGQQLTPNINKLLGNSLYFSNYNEEVNEGTTSDAELMTNTSVYPVRTGSTFFRFPDDKYYNSLPKIFQRQGYFTQAIHPDEGSYWNWKPALTSIGFQNCIDATHFNIDETIGLGLSDASFLRQAAPIIEKNKEPFYNFMITLTSHAPFDLPNKYRELKLDKGLDKSHLGGYLQSVHYTDKQIGIFLDKLRSSGLLENTVVVIYGDHCGIHKYYQNEVASTPGVENWMIDNHKQIPLIIYKDKLAKKEIKTTGGEIDLMPTLSYLMGINENQYINTTMGRNLLTTKKSYALWSDGKYIGKTVNKDEENEAIKGLNISDEIIRSDYFSTYPNYK